MKTFTQTDIGSKRSSNQDYCLSGLFPDGTAWAVVCDGMGGANGGATASFVACTTIAEVLQKDYAPEAPLRELMESAVAQANAKVYGLSLENEDLSGMGTTVVCAAAGGGKTSVLHAGDSRAYLYSEGSLRQVTRDHSVVQELIDSGQLTPEEAKWFPGRSMITRALGTEPELQTDFGEFDFPEGSLLLICSDGLSNYCSDDFLQDFLREHPAGDLPGLLIQYANEQGGSDNITVAVIEG